MHAFRKPLCYGLSFMTFVSTKLIYGEHINKYKETACFSYAIHTAVQNDYVCSARDVWTLRNR